MTGKSGAGENRTAVCGQGWLETFMALHQDGIPTIIIDADESDCLVMSLVERSTSGAKGSQASSAT